MRKMNDWEGFKYLNRLTFKVEVEAFTKVISELEDNVFDGTEISHEKSDRYVFNIDSDHAKEVAINNLCSGLIISIDNSIHWFGDVVGKKFSLKREKIEACGPRIGMATWASGVRAAGNYVRHQREWARIAVAHCKKVGLSSGGYLSYSPGELRNKVFPFTEGDRYKSANKSIEILEYIGIDLEELLPGPSSMYFEISKQLNLLDSNILYTQYCDYQNDIERTFQISNS